MAGASRFEHMLVWRIQALLEAGRISDAAASAAALTEVYRSQNATTATINQTHAAAGAGHAREGAGIDARGTLIGLLDAMRLVHEASTLLGKAEAMEGSVLAGDGDADANLWPRERKWCAECSRAGGDAGGKARLLLENARRANETLAKLTPAVDNAVRASDAALKSTAGSRWHARQYGALLGVAVEVEKVRLLLVARLLRLAAKPGACVGASLHALALHGDEGWLNASSSAAAKVRDVFGGPEQEAALQRVRRFRDALETANAALGPSTRVSRQDTPKEGSQRSSPGRGGARAHGGSHAGGEEGRGKALGVGAAVGMEILSECIEGLAVARVVAALRAGPEGAGVRQRDASAWRNIRLPMLKDLAVLVAQRAGLLAPDRHVALALKLEAAGVASRLVWQAPRPNGAILRRLLTRVAGQLSRETAVILHWLFFRVPRRIVGRALLRVRTHMLRLGNWVEAGGPQRLSAAVCARLVGGLESVRACWIHARDSALGLCSHSWYAGASAYAEVSASHGSLCQPSLRPHSPSEMYVCMYVCMHVCMYACMNSA